MAKLARFSNRSRLNDVTEEEMRTVIEKMVERYSGALNTAIANDELKKIVLSFPTDNESFKSIENEEMFNYLRNNKPNIVEDFVKAINADTKIVHKFDSDMVSELENELIRLGFISATNREELIFEENIGWKRSPMTKDYYLIQPAVKYYHLKKALEFVNSNEHYLNLSESAKNYITDKLDTKIRGDMTEQIVVYEMSKILPTDRYLVTKVCFKNVTDPKAGTGEYDMLIYDKESNSYWAFEIKHTTESFHKQSQHLENEHFKEIIDRNYGNRENVCVLYNGTSFKTPSDILYLNISDFVKEISRCRDVKTAIQNLTCNLPVKEMGSKSSVENSQQEGKSQKAILNSSKKKGFEYGD